ncbi:hypothetical protein O181_016164 [Austropuccinia psidii MF-1]|uniref:Uncharacterized protein n=1 Tax=Austropuccinia psidii MF-1 TaxID=1389203 RepID=A0A9Q3C3B8_9BASI|nr:hypothetical protein [Austropuccinia psidii MF-1]
MVLLDLSWNHRNPRRSRYGKPRNIIQPNPTACATRLLSATWYRLHRNMPAKTRYTKPSERIPEERHLILVNRRLRVFVMRTWQARSPSWPKPGSSQSVESLRPWSWVGRPVGELTSVLEGPSIDLGFRRSYAPPIRAYLTTRLQHLHATMYLLGIRQFPLPKPESMQGFHFQNLSFGEYILLKVSKMNIGARQTQNLIMKIYIGLRQICSKESQL